MERLSIKEIYKRANEYKQSNNSDNMVECYEHVLIDIINDKYIYLSYKVELEKMLDLNFSAFWLATIALMVVGFADNIIISLLAMFMGVGYYYSVKFSRDKYFPMIYALNEIGKKLGY